MKLIESKVEIIEQQPGLEGMYKHIELAGRVSYKSEDKITEDSAKEFVDRMIKSKHGAVLEHGTVYLVIPFEDVETRDFYRKNKYSKYRQKPLKDFPEIVTGFVTTNLRVLVENNRLDDLKYIWEPTEHHEKRISAKFTIDRINSQSIVRHRTIK